ncbi:MAG: Tex family protein [Erysipelotrichia bacterium]|nr:Tex family protein [Erysipelotrichia bacterium]
MEINKQLASELNISLKQTDTVIKLLDEGNTVPFIARYRKEATGNLSDELLRTFEERLAALRVLNEKKEDIKRLIENQDKLTEELIKKIDNATTLTELEDIYRPYRPKRRTRATIAKEKGLEKLAQIILLKQDCDLQKESSAFIDPQKEVNTIKDALNGAKDIIAEMISDNADYRKEIRFYTFNNGFLISKSKTDQDSVYRNYYDFKEPLKKLVSHRILAINRGEKEGFLTVKIEADENYIYQYIADKIINRYAESANKQLLQEVIADSYKRLIQSSIETEIRNDLTANAQSQAIEVFKENLKNLLLQPPIVGKVVMGFDPAYRTGCKIAIVDDIGNPLDTTVVYPTPPQNKTAEAAKELTNLIDKYHVDIISVGNGTASKESEIFVADLIKHQKHPVSYLMTNEAGASVYSASKLAIAEFPQYDLTKRSAISIARRIQDPLAELVKIDPKSIGVGQYQHDMNQKELSVALDGVVENCVSSVGVELNTASVSLLKNIAGISAKTAENIVTYRENKRFGSREELKQVTGIGEKAYQQAAGFIRVADSAEILDNTAVHPESYEAAKKILAQFNYTEDDIKNHNLKNLPEQIKKVGHKKLAEKLNIGELTLNDIVKELLQPARDPRSELPAPILRSDIMDISYLKEGMILTGTVRNVADFGAFVDIGVHQDGLIHISKLSKSFVKKPTDVISVGETVKVKVLEVDVAKKRIALEKVFD